MRQHHVHRTRVAALGLLAMAAVALGVRAPVPATAPGEAWATTLAAMPPSSASAPAPQPAPPHAPVTPPSLPPLPLDPDEGASGDGSSQLVVPDAVAAAAADTDPAASPPTAPTTPVEPAVGDTAWERFTSQFPAQAAATEDPDDPATARWAVLVGVNDHQGSTRDNIGSRQDAEAAYALLMDRGWRPDHVLLLTDELAIRETMVEGLRWLARRTTEDSVAIVSYSGHVKQWHGIDFDGDGEATDEGLWPSDNDHITDREFADLVGSIRAGRLWVNIMGCEAAGLLDPGVVRDGVIATFSSAEDEKSYEDPAVDHSVWGWNLFARALGQGVGDADGDGAVSVQEAATYAIPRATQRTQGQWPYGAQHGGMIDRSGGVFSLAVPAVGS